MSEQLVGQLTSVSELEKRYGVSKAAFYGQKGRFTRGNIKTISKYRQAHVDARTLMYLDTMDSKLKEGYTLDRFIAEYGQLNPTPEPLPQPIPQASPQPVDEPAGEIVAYRDAELVTEYKDELVVALESLALELSQGRSPLWRHRDLQEASDKGWLLTTSQLAAITGRSPDHTARKSTHEWGGFVLEKTGGRQGQEFLWSVRGPL